METLVAGKVLGATHNSSAFSKKKQASYQSRIESLHYFYWHKNI